MIPAAYNSDQKRRQLVRAASGLIHEQGFQPTTLAEVAGRARVPLGNVYYYFKTKDALAEAVIDAHVSSLESQFAAWTEAWEDPRDRLRCLIRAPLQAGERVARFGCPHGSLCQELEKLASDAPLARSAARLLTAYIEWAAKQFRALGGTPKDARMRAELLVAAVQGTMLVAHTLHSREFLARQLAEIERGLYRASPGGKPNKPNE